MGSANPGEGSGETEDREAVMVAVAGSGGVVEANTDTDLVEGEWLVDEHPRMMTQQKLDWLREEYAISSSVRLRAPTGDEKPSNPPLGG